MPYHVAYGQIDLTWDWCGQGVIGYLAVRRDDASTLVCALSDAGKVDAFLQRTLGSARQVLDQMINTELNLRLARLIARLSLEQLLESVLGRAAARRVLGGFDERFRRQLELELRSLIHQAKDRLVAEVSARLRTRLRELLAELLAAACVGVAVLTVDELLRRLRDRLRPVIWGEALLVAQRMVEEVMRMLATVVAAALVFAIASLLIAVLIADDASLIGILDDAAIAPLAGAVAWASRILASAAEILTPPLRTLLTASAVPAAAASAR